jgi:hypothetical protein
MMRLPMTMRRRFLVIEVDSEINTEKADLIPVF